MRICVVGAGSIGGLLAVRLAQARQEVSVVARGAHLAAIQANGLSLIEVGGQRVTARLRATHTIADCGLQDCVILGMKAHQIAEAAPALPALFDRDAFVVTAQNGLPWWYFAGLDGPYAGRRLESVDPGGVIADHLPVTRVVGSVVYPAAEIVEPGVIRHIEGNRFSLGEIDGTKTDRLRTLSEILTEAGFKAPISSDLRAEIWTKLWGNMSFNPISALTHATLEEICASQKARALAADMMREAQMIGEKLGVRFRISIEKRIAAAASVGAHKTSMLQDLEAGRTLEIGALIGSVVELGEITGTPTPAISAVYACANLLGETVTARKARLSMRPLSPF